MKISYKLLLLLTLLFSCEKEDDGINHYQFKPEDEKWFTFYKIGDTITFASDTAPGRKYVVQQIYDERKIPVEPKLYLLATKPRVNYYYDQRSIVIRRINGPWPGNSPGGYSIKMGRYPVFNSATQRLNITSKESVFVLSAAFDDYNVAGFNRDLLVKSTVTPVPYITLEINGISYTDVAYFNSNNPNSFCSSCPTENPLYENSLRVNQVYYQRQYGVIKFSDLDGQVWILKR
jgi:hypothetical protein